MLMKCKQEQGNPRGLPNSLKTMKTFFTKNENSSLLLRQNIVELVIKLKNKENII